METSAWLPNLFDSFDCKLWLETLLMQAEMGIEFFVTGESLE